MCQRPATWRVIVSDTVFYFAYGSSMSTATFRGRRGIEFRSATAACARGYRLVLDKPALIGVKYAFANLRADASAEVWGVLYEITRSDLEHIDLTEGVLTIEFESGEQFVLNVHEPAREIWLSANRRAWHFAPRGDDFVSTAAGAEPLMTVLSELVGEKLGRRVVLAAD